MTGRGPHAGLPLAGVRVLVTRPLQPGVELAQAVRDAGGEALLMPAVQIEPRPRDAVLAELGEAVATRPGLTVFISPNAVAHGAWLLREGHLRTDLIAAIGEATGAALAAAGLPVDITPESGYTSEALLAHPALAPGRLPATGLIVRGAGGRELLATVLGERGMRVRVLDVYRRRRPPTDDAATARHLLRAAPDAAPLLVTATSVEILDNVQSMLGEAAGLLRERARLVTPSERVVRAAVEAGFRLPPLRSSGPGNAALIQAMADWCEEGAGGPAGSGEGHGTRHE